MNKRADVMSLKYDGSRNLTGCRFFEVKEGEFYSIIYITVTDIRLYRLYIKYFYEVN